MTVQDAVLAAILVIVAAHFTADLYQDWPSLTGFYDHTVACK
jgi:hypothetical protein